MKRNIILLMGAVAIAALLCSCEKDRKLKEMLEEAHDAVYGRYELIEMKWLDNSALDLDGDGNASDNLLLEFSNLFDEHTMDFKLHDSRISTDGVMRYPDPTIEQLRRGAMSLTIPFQCIEETILNGEMFYRTSPIFMSFGTRYEVCDDGSYVVETINPNWSDSQSLDMSHLRDMIVTIPSPGRIQMDVDCMFYDRRTEKLVSGPVRFRFARYTAQGK